MNKRVYFGVSPEALKNVAEDIRKNSPESQGQIVPFIDVVTKAPSKKGKHKGYYKIEITALIPEDSLETNGNAITDFGGFIYLTLPKNIVADHLKKKE